MSDSANEIRGEVDLELEGQRFVLRPSFEAILEVETRTGKGLMELASLAYDSQLSLRLAAMMVTQFIKAWAKAEGDQLAQGIKEERIGELIHEKGLMAVVPRLALLLARAVTGDYRADGTPKAGELTAAEMTIATSAADTAE